MITETSKDDVSFLYTQRKCKIIAVYMNNKIGEGD